MMQYSAWDNQLINLSRYALAFILVFLIFPRVLFKEHTRHGLDAFWSRYLKMTGLVIGVVYVLVIIKLYELISFLAVVTATAVYKNYVKGNDLGTLRENAALAVSWIYDFLDRKKQLAPLVTKWVKRTFESGQDFILQRAGGIVPAASFLGILVVLASSIYLRYYDAMINAAPAMSDAYVTMAWTKYAEQNILFHDGIYPYGFYNYISILHKFAFSNLIYVLKYTGPLNSVLTVAAIYYIVSRFSGRTVPGIVAAFIYGVMIDSLHLYWDRQVATNSQEFALVFLFPGWYFTAKYLKSFSRDDLWPAAASFVVIGWVHSVAFVFLSIGVILLMAARLTVNFKGALGPLRGLTWASAAVVGLSVLPAVVGLLLNRSFNTSAVDFLTAQVQASIPQITLIDEIALGSIGLFFIVGILSREFLKDRFIALFVFLLGITAFGMYMFIGVITGNTMMASRFTVLWGLVIPMGIGLGWAALFQLLPGGKMKRGLEIALCLVLMGILLVYLKPSPVIPYKMQRNSAVEQYLRITREFRPTEWMMVSPVEGYSLSLGIGYHLVPEEFLKWYDPQDKQLAREVNGRKEYLDSPDIFIFKEKRLFTVSVYHEGKDIMEPVLKQRAEEYRQLDEWVQKYKAVHDDISVYYEDDNLVIWQIHRTKSREQVLKEIWGEPSE